MNNFVRFGVILHHTATIVGWIFCLILLGHPEERSLFGFVLLLAWTFFQSIGALELIARFLLGRLDEKAERMQQSFVQWQTLFGEKKAKRAFMALLIAMVASKLVLPVGLNQI